MFTSRDIGYLGNLIEGIFSNLPKGVWDTFLFAFRDRGDWYPPPPPIQASFVYNKHEDHTLHCNVAGTSEVLPPV